MSILLPVIGVINVAVLVLVYILTSALLKATSHVTKVNSQLLLLIAGKEQGPETMRALVAHDRKPPQSLKSVATGIVKEKKEDKPKNQDYTMSVGGKQ